MENLQGTFVKGYQLEERIGNGGFGAVYRAKQTTIGREVAIKIILPSYANNPDFIRRFESEANLIARLEHPHITPLYDFWRDPNGAYLVMRHLRGGSLRDALVISSYELPAVSQLLDQLASALDFAHRNNVIHRDIKPENILLDEDGNSYLADFGIAKDLTGISDNKTAADAVIGSLDYISPEQARSEAVTPRTDIYSLGVTLYEIITGKHPFHNAKTIERLYKHINDKLPEIENLPDAVRDTVNAIIQKATAKNPTERYADVLELAAAFRAGIGLGTASDGNIVEQLTMREQEVLFMVAKGMSNREIADELVVTLATVKWHVNQLYRKLGVRSRVQAIVRARELDLIITGDMTDSLFSVSSQAVSIALPEPENPYKGLHAFQMTDARDFFGRDALIQKLVDQMCVNDPFHRFLAVVGPSGSGKSSLVKAGLIPALWRGAIRGSEKWFVVDMIPGSYPLDKLEVALMRVAAQQTGNLREQLQRDERGLLRVADLILPHDDTELVIVVDQFEEVFTLVEAEKSRQHFLDLLRIAVSDVRSRVRVVVTLRADYYDRPLHYPEFGELLRSRMETVLPLSAKGLERAVRGPAERVGVLFEQGLVEQIVSAMNYQSGALPLLQYALTELFDRRKGRLLTYEAYQKIGGAVGALANRADEIYQSLSAEGQELAHQMFMRLVTLGEGAEDTRRRASQAELLSLTENTDLMEEVIDQFADYRLLSLDHDPQTRQPTVEVAHEAILREWDRLRQWLNESREDIRQERSVSLAAEEWNQHRRDKSYLLRGVRLEEVKKWRDTTALILTPLEQAFLVQSLQEREQEQQTEVKRRNRETQLEQRSRNFLRGLVAVFALATLIATGLTIIALISSAEAARERDNAEESFLRAERIRFAAQAQLALDRGEDVRIPALLALRSLELGYSPEADGALITALSRTFSRQTYIGHTGSGVTCVAFLDDGNRVLTASTDGTIRLWNTFTGEEIHRYTGHRGSVNDFVVMPDDKSFISGGNDGTLRLWSVDSGEEVQELVDVGTQIRHLALSPNGHLLAVSDQDNGLNIWQLANMTLRYSLFGHTDLVHRLEFSPDGTILASPSQDGTIRLWSMETGEEIQRIEGHVAGVWGVSFSPDGRSIATASSDQTVRLWNIETGEELQRFIGHSSSGQSITFSPDGRMLATGSPNDLEVYLWDVDTGQLVTTLGGHTNGITTLAFSPDGQYLLSGSVDSIPRLWVVEDETEPRVFTQPLDTVHANTVRAAILLPDASHIISVLSNGMVRTWDVLTYQKVKEVRAESSGFVTDAAISTERNLVLTGNDGGIARLWHLETGELIRQYEGHSGAITSVAFAASTDFFITGSSDNIAVLWAVDSNSPIIHFEGHIAPITDVSISPDNRFIATASEDGLAILWDAETGAEIRRFVGGKEGIVLSVAFSPDGRYLLTGCDDNTASLWNTETGEVVQQLVGHTDQVLVVAFSEDGQTLVTGSRDQTARLWDAESGQLIRQFVGHTSSVRTIDLSDDVGLLVTGDIDSTYLWRTSLEDIIALACEKISNDLTAEERSLYEINDDREVCDIHIADSD
jgi:WD40 repeat protein/DNA-binding CsgD family transcriptional regulator